jgi:hypothetical protein
VISGRRAKDTEQGQVDGGGGVVEEEQEEENKGGTRDEERESAEGGTTVRNSSEARTFLLVRNAGFSSRCRFVFDAPDARGELQASSSSPSFMTTGLPANSRTTTQDVSTNGDEEVSWLWSWRRCGRRRRRRRW